MLDRILNTIALFLLGFYGALIALHFVGAFEVPSIIFGMFFVLIIAIGVIKVKHEIKKYKEA